MRSRGEGSTWREARGPRQGGFAPNVARRLRGGQAPSPPGGALPLVFAVTGVLALAMVVVAAAGVRRPDPPTFEPSPLAPRPVATSLVGPELVTIDAADAARWRFFSFAHGSVIERPSPRDWDLAFRRFQVIVNGGAGFAGDGGVAALDDVAFDAVLAAPLDGYVPNTVRSDTTNAAIRKWYEYSFLSHLLTPSPRVYVVRTADGRYAKLEFVGYYCPGARPGCVTFRYVYQPERVTSFARIDGPSSAEPSP